PRDDRETLLINPLMLSLCVLYLTSAEPLCYIWLCARANSTISLVLATHTQNTGGGGTPLSRSPHRHLVLEPGAIISNPCMSKLAPDTTALPPEVLAKYEPVIGLEVHDQLLTNTKIFCACSTRVGDAPNANTCPVCLGL